MIVFLSSAVRESWTKNEQNYGAQRRLKMFQAKFQAIIRNVLLADSKTKT